MQTLIDPFELALAPVVVVDPETPEPDTGSETAEILDARAESEPPSLPRSPDSSGRLRYWCSEE